MSGPLISVIIPSYNRAHLINEACNSVLSQTYSNIELIIVDDCSTDKTKELVSSIKDSRVHYYCLEKNSGACIARNLGIEKATGDYIAFNDSDDRWHSDKLEKQISFLIENNADVTVCSMDVFDEDSSVKMYTFPDSKKCPEGPVNFEQLLKYNCTSTQMLLGKTICFKENPFDSNMPRFQDWEECLRLCKKYTLLHQDEVLVDTYQQKDSITKNPQKGVIGMQMLYEKHRDAILSSPSITESFFKKMSSFTCRCGRNPVMEMTYIFKSHRNLTNLLKLVLAKTGVYKIISDIKN